jgi:hypothetical protein
MIVSAKRPGPICSIPEELSTIFLHAGLPGGGDVEEQGGEGEEPDALGVGVAVVGKAVEGLVVGGAVHGSILAGSSVG